MIKLKRVVRDQWQIAPLEYKEIICTTVFLPKELLTHHAKCTTIHSVISRNYEVIIMGNAELKTCKVVCYNQAKIESLKKRIPSQKTLSDGSERFKAMGHPQRLAILHVLLESECCVCDLANVLKQPVSTISQHLKILKTAGLLNSRQDGKLVFYNVTKPEFINNSII